MRNKMTLRVDHVGAPLFAHFDLRHEIENELQIDLGNADSGIAKAAGKRNRHVRFGFATKIDRPIVNFICHRIYEAGVVGKIGIAANLVHFNARNAQLFMAASIELYEFGDGGYLAEQTRSIKLELFGGARGLRHLSGPTQLAFDLPDEAANLVSCRIRLLMLDTDERRFVIPIIKPDLERAVRQQSHADNGRKQSDIFAKKPAPLHTRGRCQGAREPPRCRWYPSHDSVSRRAR